MNPATMINILQGLYIHLYLRNADANKPSLINAHVYRTIDEINVVH